MFVCCTEFDIIIVCRQFDSPALQLHCCQGRNTFLKSHMVVRDLWPVTRLNFLPYYTEFINSKCIPRASFSICVQLHSITDNVCRNRQLVFPRHFGKHEKWLHQLHVVKHLLPFVLAWLVIMYDYWQDCTKLLSSCKSFSTECILMPSHFKLKQVG